MTTNKTLREELTKKVNQYIEYKIAANEFTGVQLAELEHVLVSMCMQDVNPDLAESFLKATGMPESYGDKYREFIIFDPEDFIEKEAEDIGRVVNTKDNDDGGDEKSSEDKAKGARTAFNFVARELGVFNPNSTAEEQLSAIMDKIKEFKEAYVAGGVGFARTLYTTCYNRHADNITVEDIVRDIQSSVRTAEEFNLHRLKLQELINFYK